MNIMGRIFGTGDTINKSVDAVISTGDKLFYTDEEKAEAAQKKQEFWVKILSAYEPFKVAQRFLALIYSVPYVFLVTTGLVLEIITGVPNLIAENANDALGIQNMIILSFYFGGGAFEGVVKAKAGIK